MVTTIFSDDVINSTELRNNQKRWLDKAYNYPVSIMSGVKKLVLLNREHAKDMYLENHYAKMIINFCQEQNAGQTTKSDVFPWIENLSESALTELLSTFGMVIHSKDWLALEEMLNDWISTAEAMTNPEMVELLSSGIDNEEFTRVE